MRNSKFVCYGVVLLGLVVLCTKAQNGFCPMCTKECYIVLNRFKPFWGQFWGQICKTDSHTHQSNKCAALVSLRKLNTSLSEFSHRKSPRTSNEVLLSMQKLYANPLHAILAHRPCHRETCLGLGAFAARRRGTRPAIYRPKIPAFRGFFILPQRHLPRLDFPVQVNQTQINTK